MPVGAMAPRSAVACGEMVPEKVMCCDMDAEFEPKVC